MKGQSHEAPPPAHRAVCPDCGRVRHLQPADAYKTTRCRRCHCRRIAPLGFQATAARQGRDVAIRAAAEKRRLQPSSLERQVEIALGAIPGIAWEREHAVERAGCNPYYVDFAITTDQRFIALEVNGCYAHRHDDDASRLRIDALHLFFDDVIVLAEDAMRCVDSLHDLIQHRCRVTELLNQKQSKFGGFDKVPGPILTKLLRQTINSDKVTGAILSRREQTQMVPTAPIRGDFPSLKLRRMVRYHSTIERDLLYFLEFWQAVTWYCEQPMTIERIVADGTLRHYTPDYEIHEGNIRILAECKPADRLASSHAQQQRHIGQAWAEENGYRFVTFTDTELRNGHMLANLKLLWRYARLREKPLAAAILSHIRHHRQSSMHILGETLQQPSRVVLPTVCHLLFQHQLDANLHHPLTLTTALQIKDDP